VLHAAFTQPAEIQPHMLAEVISFDPSQLRPTHRVETSITNYLKLGTENDEAPSERWEKGADGWRPVSQDVRLTAPFHECHGQCYHFEAVRDAWKPPRLVFYSAAEARPGYNTRSASEYLDDEDVLQAKVTRLAQLVSASRKTVVYAGAGLSTAAGISDYATIGRTKGQVQATLGGELAAAVEKRESKKPASYLSPMCAQPSLSHRVLVGMYRAGFLQRVIQQNHDGLPQKAGMPQHIVNEIHGALHAPDNPVVPMSGSLRDDLFADLLESERTADLTIAVGTSLCGMNADRVVSTPAEKAPSTALGSVVIGLQRTALDDSATLRLFARCDDVFRLLSKELALEDVVPEARPEGAYFCPPVLEETQDTAADPEQRYLLSGLCFDAMGRRVDMDTQSNRAHWPQVAGICSNGTSTKQLPSKLDVRDGAQLIIPSGLHAGAMGEVDGCDREGNPRCRFRVNLKKNGTFKAAHMMVLGTWWLQAAAEGSIIQLPVVNPPADDDTSPAAMELRALCKAY